MKVKIAHLFGDWEEYVADTRDDCKDDYDKSLYDLVHEHDDIITMGLNVASPVREVKA